MKTFKELEEEQLKDMIMHRDRLNSDISKLEDSLAHPVKIADTDYEEIWHIVEHDNALSAKWKQERESNKSEKPE